MSNVISPNMNLPIPSVGTTPGPDYAFSVDSALTLIDQHDHSPGKGVPITSASLNINAALSMNNNFLTNIAGLTLTPQSSTPGVNTIYESGVDLFYVDGVGNNIRITQSGGVAGTPGSIANLVPPASASYVAGSKTFVWQSGTNLAANMDFAAAIFRNISPNSTFGITLQAPALLGSNWTLTLPSIPVANSFMQLDTSGNISASIPLANGITTSNIALGMQVAAIVQTVTTTATVGFTSNIVNASTAASYTLTMYTAVGNGQTVRVRKTSNDFNILTISLVGGSTTTTTLNTLGEEVELTSDGTNWIIVSRYIPSAWASFTFTSFGGIGGLINQTSRIQRIGDSLHISFTSVLSPVSSALGGINLPSGLTVNPSFAGDLIQNFGTFHAGTGNNPYGATSREGMVTYVPSSSTSQLHFSIGGALTGGTGSSPSMTEVNSGPFSAWNGAIVGGSGNGFLSFTAIVPIAGWNG